ncbi:hypothetical protein QQ045_006496 [Rhodiola kirilowii]
MAQQAANVDIDSWAPQNVTPTVIKRVEFPGVADLPRYDLMNGSRIDIRPYLLRSTLPEAYKWVKIGGMDPANALKYMDAFIKSAWYQVERNQPRESTAETRRRDAFILGVTRCVMVADYRLVESDFVPGEMVGPYIDVTEAPNGEVTYTLVANPEVDSAGTEVMAALLDRFEMSPNERGALTAIMRSAKGIIPVQGHNLINDGHHYLNQADKASFKAFLNMERQLWIGESATAVLKSDLKATRDIMWHKAGHPVAIAVKLRAATSEKVAEDLVAAGLGSAAARLPAIEPDLRPIDTYLKLTESCKKTLEMNEGTMDNRVFHDIKRALRAFPIGDDGADLSFAFGPYRVNGRVVTAKNRAEVVEFSRSVIERSREKMALCYGYFTRLVDSQSMTGTGGMSGSDSLRRDFSLKKLKDEYPGQYFVGYEMATDCLAFRSKKMSESNHVFC